MSFSTYTVSLYGHGDAKAQVGFQFSSRDDLYQRFVSLLQQAIEKAKEDHSSKQFGVSERIRLLSNLHKEGFISDAEFKQKREDLIKQL